MDTYISVENLIEEAKKQHLDLGKGNPYNRLRYYTKMGWLPHMVRIKEEKNETTGHYPKSTLQRLIQIENMKAKKYSNAEISEKIKTSSRWEIAYSLVNTKNLKLKTIVYSSFVLILFIVATEAGIIHLGKTKNYLKEQILTNIKP